MNVTLTVPLPWIRAAAGTAPELAVSLRFMMMLRRDLFVDDDLIEASNGRGFSTWTCRVGAPGHGVVSLHAAAGERNEGQFTDAYATCMGSCNPALVACGVGGGGGMDGRAF